MLVRKCMYKTKKESKLHKALQSNIDNKNYNELP